MKMNLGNTLGEELNGSDKPNTTSYKSFHYLEDGSVDFSILSTEFTTKKLNKGVYNLFVKVVNGNNVAGLEINQDEENFDQEISFAFDDKINEIYNKFFDANIKAMVNKLGYNHKLGILLHGKQGTGKTSMFKKYFKHAVENHNAIIFNITDYGYLNMLLTFVSKIRKIQTNPIIIFMDEFETIFEYHSNEATLKTSMDGFSSMDNSMFMLATNYINKVPDSIKKRPSRVKHCIEVQGITDVNVISKFLKSSFDKIELDIDFSNEVEGMKGWTLDELKQWVLDKVMDIEPETHKSSKIGFAV